MQYEITWLEQKTTSTGKVKANAQLRGAEGKIIENVTIWSDYPDFSNLRPGSTVEGDLVPSRDPKYGPTLYGKRKESNLGPKPAWARKETNIAQAQERKAGYIKEAQDRKEMSIAYFNSLNSAIAIVNGPIGQLPSRLDTEAVETLKENIAYWRDWFYSEWQKWESQDPDDKKQPF